MRSCGFEVGGVVTDGPLRLSPTQIEVFERCERLWVFDRVLKLRDRVTTKSQGIGIRVEDMIADKLFKNEDPPAGKEGAIAKAMLKLLPEPGTPGMVSQQAFEFEILTPEGPAIVNGKKDLVLPGVRVIDFKTTKSLSKWQKTPAMLQADIQSEIYAYDEWLKSGLNPIPLDWVYGQTEGAQKADHTAILMTLETAKRGVQRAGTAAEKMIRYYADKPAVETVPANTRACDMFGGCAHRAYCPARASRLADYLPKENVMGFKDKLKASLGIVDASKVTPEMLVIASGADVILGSNDKPIQVPDPEKRCIACEGTGWNSKGGPCKICEGSGGKPTKVESAAPAQGINPPDALPSLDDAPKAPAAGTTEATSAEEKPKRTRRTKEQIAADLAAQATSEVNQHMIAVKAAHAAEDEAKSTVETPTPSRVVATLLVIDGVALKGGGNPLEPLLRRAAELAAEKAGMPDWRFVDYGKGAGLLLLSFAELWEKDPPRGLLTISSRAPEAGPVLTWLIDRVDLVVKGI